MRVHWSSHWSILGLYDMFFWLLNLVKVFLFSRLLDTTFFAFHLSKWQRCFLWERLVSLFGWLGGWDCWRDCCSLYFLIIYTYMVQNFNIKHWNKKYIFLLTTRMFTTQNSKIKELLQPLFFIINPSKLTSASVKHFINCFRTGHKRYFYVFIFKY